MTGQHGAGQVVEAGRTRLASVTLPMRLRVVASVPDDRGTIASGAARTLRSAVLAHKCKALGVVHQSGKVGQVRCSHDRGGSSRKPVGCPRSRYHIRPSPAAPLGSLPRNPTRATRESLIAWLTPAGASCKISCSPAAWMATSTSARGSMPDWWATESSSSGWAARPTALIPDALMNDRFLKRASMRSAQCPSHRTGQQSGRLVSQSAPDQGGANLQADGQPARGSDPARPHEA